MNVERRTNRGIALVLTMAVALIFLILVAGFYQVVIGRQGWVRKRSGRSEAFYKAEAGAHDAMARLRVGKIIPTPVGAIDPALAVGLVYCLDIDATPPNADLGGGGVACPIGGAGWGVWDVRVEVDVRDPATGLNEIRTETNY